MYFLPQIPSKGLLEKQLEETKFFMLFNASEKAQQ